ncbi:MAG: hypothetical protein R3D51_07280 [Hyphomicrobiaceae bacterium]
MSKGSGSTGDGGKAAANRAERLAAELRANLRKRKAVARARSGPHGEPANGEIGAAEPKDEG